MSKLFVFLYICELVYVGLYICRNCSLVAYSSYNIHITTLIDLKLGVGVRGGLQLFFTNLTTV